MTCVRARMLGKGSIDAELYAEDKTPNNAPMLKSILLCDFSA